MTGIVSHQMRKTAWHQVRHTYLFDVGMIIDVPLMDISKLYENCLLDPPYPRTRYFEVEVDEHRDGRLNTVLFQNIFPVNADRKPDWYFLTFRIRTGSWTITERIHFPTDTGEAQWLYTDDFNLLFLSSGGRHDLEMLASLITGRLNTIAQSFRAGNPVPSEFEIQLQCRNAISSLFGEGVDRAFQDAAIYRDFGIFEPVQAGITSDTVAGAEICSRHGKALVSLDKAADLHVDISEIEELRELGWLSN
jgi:hypothetical protein